MFFIPVYILILVFTIIIDYIAGILIEKQEGKKRWWFLLMSLIANIGVLAVFKYYNFFADNIMGLGQLMGFKIDIPYLSLILPIGLSFHTFQAMSYTLEVYHGRYKAERNFGIYALYVLFYPQLVAGPIERPQNLLHQFREKKYFDYDRAASGMKLMLWGLFKKVVVADRLGAYVANVFNYPQAHSGETMTFWVGAWFFAFQLYCDFSGYSDIAIGAARMMGFKLMLNFRRPYQGQSVGEVWQRWHISLTTWFTDYVFKPLGGYRQGKWRGIFNLGVIMFLAGLWHGANWTYVVCFLIFFFWLSMRLIFRDQIKKFDQLITFKKAPVVTRIINTFLAFHCGIFPFVFFRSRNVEAGWYYIKQMFTFHFKTFYVGDIPTMVYGVLFLVILYAIEVYQEAQKNEEIVWPEPKNRTGKYVFYAGVISVILLFGVFDASQFIYFQF